MRRDATAFIAPILLFCGLIFGVLAIALGVFAARHAGEAAARAERLTALTAATFEDIAPGQEVLIDGRISDSNAVRFRNLVAYVRQEYRGPDNSISDSWMDDERVTPAVLIDLPDGQIQITNGYLLESPPQSWQESQSLTWNGLTNEGTKRYSGFAAGDSVLAIGTIVAGSEGPVVDAEFLYGGNRTDYLAVQRGNAATLPWIGLGLGTLSLSFFSIGLWRLFRHFA